MKKDLSKTSWGGGHTSEINFVQNLFFAKIYERVFGVRVRDFKAISLERQNEAVPYRRCEGIKCEHCRAPRSGQNLKQSAQILTGGLSQQFLNFVQKFVEGFKTNFPNQNKSLFTLANLKLKPAFTLAEVLITLAIKLAEIDQNQSVYEWDYSLSPDAFWNKYLARHVNCTPGKKTKSNDDGLIVPSDNSGDIFTCYFSDGSFLALEGVSRYETGEGRAMWNYDFNGQKKPNYGLRDQFWFETGISGDPNNLENSKCVYGFTPMGFDDCMDSGDHEYYTKEWERDMCFDEGSGWNCTFYLLLNNWDFSDYPYKL